MKTFLKWITYGILTLIALLIIILAFDLRRIGSQNIENLPREQVTFDELPRKVQRVYDSVYQDENVSQFACYAISPKNSCERKIYTMENPVRLVKHGFIYEFYHGDQVFSIAANQGEPFVFYEDHIYYPEALNPNMNGHYQSIKFNQVSFK